MKKTLLTIVLLVLLVSSLMAAPQTKTAKINLSIANANEFSLAVLDSTSIPSTITWENDLPVDTAPQSLAATVTDGTFGKTDSNKVFAFSWKVYTNTAVTISATLSKLGNVDISLGAAVAKVSPTGTTTTINTSTALTSVTPTEGTGGISSFITITPASGKMQSSLGCVAFESLSLAGASTINDLASSAEATLSITIAGV